MRIRKSRRGERGAAMVEAAFMFPMFLILWFAAIAAYKIPASVIDLNSKSRSDAWARAMNNCSAATSDDPEQYPASWGNAVSSPLTNEPDIGSLFSSAMSSGSVGGIVGGVVNAITGALAEIIPNPTGSASTYQNTVNWRMSNRYANTDNASSTKLARTVTIVCDGGVQDGSVWNALTDLVGAIIGLIPSP
jgi:hypothetical protein